jgi:exosortase family protein XrtF
MWNDFKPTLLFLFRFFLTYGLLSAAYGFYIQSYDRLQPSQTDPSTQWVVQQVSFLAEILGYTTEIEEQAHNRYADLPSEQTFDTLLLDNKRAIAVEEGCNGLSVMILFVSFVLAFGGKWKKAIWFVPLGLVIIHLANLLRLLILAVLKADHDGNYFHFFHKYGFTAVIYFAVFVLWYVWVQFLVSNKPSSNLDKSAEQTLS